MKKLLTPDRKRQLRKTGARSRRWARRWLPPGARFVVGIVLIVSGSLGFLPVLGFWMIPLGIAIASIDLKPLLRWWRARRRK